MANPKFTEAMARLCEEFTPGPGDMEELARLLFRAWLQQRGVANVRARLIEVAREGVDDGNDKGLDEYAEKFKKDGAEAAIITLVDNLVEWSR